MIGDVVDKVYKREYKWVLRKKNRYGRYSLEYGDIDLGMGTYFKIAINPKQQDGWAYRYPLSRRY
jgi:hypothetical protein